MAPMPLLVSSRTSKCLAVACKEPSGTRVYQLALNKLKPAPYNLCLQAGACRISLKPLGCVPSRLRGRVLGREGESQRVLRLTSPWPKKVAICYDADGTEVGGDSRCLIAICAFRIRKPLHGTKFVLLPRTSCTSEWHRRRFTGLKTSACAAATWCLEGCSKRCVTGRPCRSSFANPRRATETPRESYSTFPPARSQCLPTE